MRRCIAPSLFSQAKNITNKKELILNQLFWKSHRHCEVLILPICGDLSDVLDKIRDIRVGDGKLSVTISVGIANIRGSFSEKERAASAALDMALQRGGDQVVVKNENGIEFYGGRTKTVQKRTKVRARVTTCCEARFVLSLRMRPSSPLSSNPAVSAITAAPIPGSSMFFHTVSVVVPATSDTMETS